MGMDEEMSVQLCSAKVMLQGYIHVGQEVVGEIAHEAHQRRPTVGSADKNDIMCVGQRIRWILDGKPGPYSRTGQYLCIVEWE